MKKALLPLCLSLTMIGQLPFPSIDEKNEIKKAGINRGDGRKDNQNGFDVFLPSKGMLSVQNEERLGKNYWDYLGLQNAGNLIEEESSEEEKNPLQLKRNWLLKDLLEDFSFAFSNQEKNQEPLECLSAQYL